ncbi:small ribosomal subunit protein uS12m-like [Acropora muricata]|uniref:28S ribosomal protein S12, mitochondrial-like n=1 Tax=Acropora millepora TaxID=45264 RepID=UPI001CF29C52|nr:28S ribosomal protein S12, mitochondrial-like [Acropora millepora]
MVVALAYRFVFGNRRFLPSLLPSDYYSHGFIMSALRRYSCLTGTCYSSTRNLLQLSNDKGTSMPRYMYVSQKTRSVHRHNNNYLWFPSTWYRQLCFTIQQSSTFTALQNKLSPNLELHCTLGARFLPTLNQYRRGKAKTKAEVPEKYIPKNKRILLGPQRKGVCVKVFTRKPKKPNSGNRKCALLKLSNGKTITAYIPGEKAVLQEHGVVLFEGGRVQDCPGIKYKIIRGKYDMN